MSIGLFFYFRHAAKKILHYLYNAVFCNNLGFERVYKRVIFVLAEVFSKIVLTSYLNHCIFHIKKWRSEIRNKILQEKD